MAERPSAAKILVAGWVENPTILANPRRLGAGGDIRRAVRIRQVKVEKNKPCACW